MTSWTTFIFFVQHSFRDVGRRKFHFFLAFCSVLIVVLSTLVVNTVIQKGPIIFMKLAQAETGEIDCIYTAQGRQQNSNDYWNTYWSMNYTQAVAILEENHVEHHLSPRIQMCPPGKKIMFSDFRGDLLAPNGTMCLKFIDSEKERAIEVGVSWPYPKLEPYECLISDEFYQQGVNIGDKVSITLSWTQFWQNLRAQYNDVANLAENQWEELPRFEDIES